LPLAAKLIDRAQKNHLEMPELPAETPVDEQMLGEQLLSLVSWAITHNVDPEVALRKAALQYRAQMSEQEAQRN
jgi:hypothetical protein